jgi:hypothetical protein
LPMTSVETPASLPKTWSPEARGLLGPSKVDPQSAAAL